MLEEIWNITFHEGQITIERANNSLVNNPKHPIICTPLSSTAIIPGTVILLSDLDFVALNNEDIFIDEVTSNPC